jgi:hypothetical protein
MRQAEIGEDGYTDECRYAIQPEQESRYGWETTGSLI